VEDFHLVEPIIKGKTFSTCINIIMSEISKHIKARDCHVLAVRTMCKFATPSILINSIEQNSSWGEAESAYGWGAL
jgi:hypothetical protein